MRHLASYVSNKILPSTDWWATQCAVEQEAFKVRLSSHPMAVFYYEKEVTVFAVTGAKPNIFVAENFVKLSFTNQKNKNFSRENKIAEIKVNHIYPRVNVTSVYST